MWGPWIVTLVLLGCWVAYLVWGHRMGDSELVAYFLFFLAGMSAMVTPAGKWLTWLCGAYAGSVPATVVCLIVIIVWIAHVGFGQSPVVNYVLFLCAIIAFALTKDGALLLGSFHH